MARWFKAVRSGARRQPAATWSHTTYRGGSLGSSGDCCLRHKRRQRLPASELPAADPIPVGSARPQAQEDRDDVLIRFASSGATTTEQYDETIRPQETGDFPPKGMEYHACFLSDGNVRVSEIWDSQEQLDAFGERLMPLLADVGIDPGEPEILEIHNIVRC
jgi:hypothetical protein